jgi:predicted unusual protein kinase regulating ubiquinone biosynthesis (AarF/ABC1/UbiB family)
MVDSDADALGDHLLLHGLIDYDVDIRKVKKQIRQLFRELSGGGGDMRQRVEKMMQFVVEHKVAFPPDLFFLDKVFGTLEGAVNTLSPSSGLQTLAQEYLPSLLRGAVMGSPTDLLRRLLGRLVGAEDALVSLPGRIAKVLERLDAGHLVVREHHELSAAGRRQALVLLWAAAGMGLGASMTVAATVLGRGHEGALAAGLVLFGLAGAFATWRLR